MLQLKESWASPFGLKKELVYEGTPLYSSNKLKEQLIDILTSKLSSISNEIKKLVSSNKIIPVYSSGGNVMKIGLRRIFSTDGMVDKSKGNAFYVPKLKKIFIVIDNNMSSLGFIDDKWITLICLHEMMHLCARVDPYFTWSIYKEDLYNYYSTFYSTHLGINKNNNNFIKEIKSFVYNLYKNEVKNDDINLGQTIINQGHFMVKLLKYSDLSEDNQEKMVKDTVNFMHYLSPQYSLAYYNNFKTGKLLKESYKELTGKPADFSHCYQELWTPSEVIAIMSAFSRTKPIELIKHLANKL